MIDLSRTYRHLGRPWNHDELAVSYAAANRRGEQLLSEAPDTAPDRPIALLATAIPSVATLSVAIHVVHALPDSARVKLAAELLDTAGANAADALYRCHRALELDGLTHSYTADEWLPVIYDIAGQLLESSHLDQEPPTLVQQTQDAVRWLSASIARLDEDSRDAAAAPRRHARPAAGRVRVRRRCPCKRPERRVAVHDWLARFLQSRGVYATWSTTLRTQPISPGLPCPYPGPSA